MLRITRLLHHLHRLLVARRSCQFIRLSNLTLAEWLNTSTLKGVKARYVLNGVTTSRLVLHTGTHEDAKLSAQATMMHCDVSASTTVAASCSLVQYGTLILACLNPRTLSLNPNPSFESAIIAKRFVSCCLVVSMPLNLNFHRGNG